MTLGNKMTKLSNYWKSRDTVKKRIPKLYSFERVTSVRIIHLDLIKQNVKKIFVKKKKDKNVTK